MVHLYVIRAPGSDLDGESFSVQDVNRASADIRAASRVRATFALSRRTDARAAYVATYADRRALAKAEESGIALTMSDADAVIDVLLGDDLRAAGGR